MGRKLEDCLVETAQGETDHARAARPWPGGPRPEPETQTCLSVRCYQDNAPGPAPGFLGGGGENSGEMRGQ